jgi:hypothetical protein
MSKLSALAGEVWAAYASSEPPLALSCTRQGQTPPSLSSSSGRWSAGQRPPPPHRVRGCTGRPFAPAARHAPTPSPYTTSPPSSSGPAAATCTAKTGPSCTRPQASPAPHRAHPHPQPHDQPTTTRNHSRPSRFRAQRAAAQTPRAIPPCSASTCGTTRRLRHNSRRESSPPISGERAAGFEPAPPAPKLGADGFRRFHLAADRLVSVARVCSCCA